MRKLLCLLVSTLVVSNTFADITVDSLIKVTNVPNPKCLEYYSYKGALYCSIITQSIKPVDLKVPSYEKQKLVFDDRPWLMAFGSNEDYSYTVEYVPNGDHLENWHELVTSQFIPRIQDSMTPRQFVNRIMENIKNAGYEPNINIIKETPDEAIVEFQIQGPNATQDEIQRIVRTDDGFYIVHYATKDPDMGAANRTKWLTNLKNAKIADPNQ